RASSSSADRLDNRFPSWEADQDVRTDGHHDVRSVRYRGGSMATSEGSITTTVDAGAEYFTRRATGLVRAVPQRAALVFNFIPSHPAFVLSAGVFFAFSLFPGGNFLLALALDIPLVLAFAYAYGLLASMLPRTGGDYMFVTRVIHPVVGVVSSVCWMVSLFLSNAFFASSFIKVGLAPGLKVI